MKIFLKLLLLVFIFPILSNAQNKEARLLRFPTTNGEEVVFTYAGDLYKVPILGGTAMRLTSHIGYEMFAKFSPDGKTIGFTAQYDGNTEIYKIPVQGGEPSRLTYTATLERDDIGDRMGPNNIFMTWTPDGNNIVYRSRMRTGGGFEGMLFNVSKDGGLSKPLPLPEGGFCSYSPDAKKLAYNRVFREFRTWKYYKGGMADDIWVYDFATKETKNITNNDAQDIIPMWIGNEIYFISDRDKTMNLFCYNLDTKETTKVTDFDKYDIKFPSCHGNLIVFEEAGYIYKFDATTKKYEKLVISLASDDIYARDEIKSVKKKITAMSPSLSGERAVVVARGEVFNVPVGVGVTKNLTRTSNGHERSAIWSPDGKHIAYISDVTGETEIYLLVGEGGDAKQLTHNNDTYIVDMQWMPDSKKIIFFDRNNKVNLLDITTATVKTLFDIPEGGLRSLSYSENGEWLTYARNAKNDMRVIYIYNMKTGKQYPVTEAWYSSSNPVFSRNGKYLIFTSDRDVNPIYGAKEWNSVFSRGNGLYIALLSKDTPSPLIAKDAGAEYKSIALDNKNSASKKKTSKKSSTKEENTLKIDVENISDRIIRIPVNEKMVFNVFGLGDDIYFSTRGATKAFNLKTQKERKVSDAYFSVEPGYSKAIAEKGDKYYMASISDTKISLGEQINVSDLKVTINYAQEWAQIFDEAWRQFRDGFYDKSMHGVDWKAIKEKYKVFLPYVKTRLDLNYIVGEMIGEVCSGHAYFNPGEVKSPSRISVGQLGAEISLDKSGYFRIEKILAGAEYSESLRSPLNQVGLGVKVGDFITAVDGVSTKGVKDFYSMMVDKANVLTELTINSSPKSGGKKIIIKPLATEHQLYHLEWVQRNIDIVNKLSGGRIGYVYIPDMGPDGLKEFARYFYPQLDKEGLIVDDRSNGGGNVSPMILERLARKAYRVTMGRGTNRIGKVPNKTLVGPKICLINKYSASDGDLFPWGFRELGLGKLVGTRTWGGIIGISGSMSFLDGSDLRVPFFTSFSAKTGDWIIENHGVDPDIVVDNDPYKEWNGEDQQLETAVKEIMKELKNRKPLPKVAPKSRIMGKNYCL